MWFSFWNPMLDRLIIRGQDGNTQQQQQQQHTRSSDGCCFIEEENKSNPVPTQPPLSAFSHFPRINE